MRTSKEISEVYLAATVSWCHKLASDKQQRFAQIPSANVSDSSGKYICYLNRHDEQFEKVVFIDLQVWSGT